jgi:hypothetical protein
MPGTTDDPVYQVGNASFLQALGELGWIVGRNVRIDYRWGAGDEHANATHPLAPLRAEQEKAGGVTAGPRQTRNQAAADRIDDLHEYDRHASPAAARAPRAATPQPRRRAA